MRGAVYFSDIRIIAPRIGLHEAEQFRTELLDYLGRYDGDVTIDCSYLNELDTAGVVALIRAEKLEKERGYALKLINLQGKARDEIKITKLESILV